MADKSLIESVLLEELNDEEKVDSWHFAQRREFHHDDVVGVMKALEAREFLISKSSNLQILNLTDEAEAILSTGSPEAKTFNAVPDEGISVDDLKEAIGANTFKHGIAQCYKNKWLKVEKVSKDLKMITKKTDSIEDALKSEVQHLKDANFDPKNCQPAILKNLKRRKLVVVSSRTIFSLKKGPKFELQRGADLDAAVTLDMIKDGSWKTREFKSYNFNATGKKIPYGCLHPLLKVRKEFRSILMEMGFEEMPTNNYVESSFWNFDTLFQPQQHPARDAHDTFFVQKPASAPLSNPEYAEKVKSMHEKGGSGSIGWRYDCSADEARKNILRTHTTAVSSRMLHKLAQQDEFEPKRYFSIDRVFRNETLDSTHLAEFHQVEGFVADYDLTLGDLIGVISKFFEKIGIPDVKFKPAYNPYTEPSMEIFGYSKEKDSWMEVGNSGIFRPEMLRPMGLPENVRVIAWGLSLERPTMIKYGVTNIRDLFGHKVDLRMVRKNPLARF